MTWNPIAGVRIGSNERRILAFLEKHNDLTALELTEMIYEKKIVAHDSVEYKSVNRSLHSLERKGLVKRISERTRWGKITAK